jgi:hypothetical protein
MLDVSGAGSAVCAALGRTWAMYACTWMCPPAVPHVQGASGGQAKGVPGHLVIAAHGV